MRTVMEKQDEKTLTVEEAGRRYFGISRAGAYRAVANGDMPSIRIGHLLRVPVAAMEKMMLEGKKGSSGNEPA
jgi:excisionase family DNA binding protein